MLAGWLILCQAAGVLGSFFTIPSIPTWFEGLSKPMLTPPNGVFGPVWTTLFVLMAVAAFLVSKEGIIHQKVRIALAVFGVQLVLNVLWSAVFFGMHNLFGAMIEITVFWISIAATIYLFSKISRTAALIMLPYLGWVTFASYLTFAIWQLNA